MKRKDTFVAPNTLQPGYHIFWNRRAYRVIALDPENALLLHVEPIPEAPRTTLSLLDYIQYADLLNSSLKEIWSVSPVSTPLDEEALLTQVDQTIREFGSQPPPGRRQRINSRTGVSIRVLKQFPRIRSRLSAWRNERHYMHAQQDSQREEELVQLVTNAIQQLESLKQPVNQLSIARIIGISHWSLRFYPRVEAILMQVASKHHLSKHQSYRVSGQNRLSSSIITPRAKETE